MSTRRASDTKLRAAAARLGLPAPIAITAREARRLARRAIQPLRDGTPATLDDGTRVRLAKSLRGDWTAWPRRTKVPNVFTDPVRDMRLYDKAVEVERLARELVRKAYGRDLVKDNEVVRPRDVEDTFDRPRSHLNADRWDRWVAAAEAWEVVEDAYAEAGAVPEADFASQNVAGILAGLRLVKAPSKKMPIRFA